MTLDKNMTLMNINKFANAFKPGGWEMAAVNFKVIGLKYIIIVSLIYICNKAIPEK